MSVILLQLQRSGYLSVSLAIPVLYKASGALLSFLHSEFNLVSSPLSLSPRAPLVAQALSLPFQVFCSATIWVVPPG